MLDFVKWAFFLFAAIFLSFFAVERLPDEWVKPIDHVEIKLVFLILGWVVAADILISIYLHFSNPPAKKFIRRLAAFVMAAGTVIVGSVTAAFSFQEAKIKANFEEALAGKGIEPQYLKATIEGSIRAAQNDAMKDMFPWFACVLFALIVFAVLYVYMDKNQADALADQARRSSENRR